MHATEFLRTPPATIPPILVLAGSQRYLKQRVLDHLRHVVLGEDESSLTRFTGKEATFQQVVDELRTVSMWGERRLVVIDDADEFISQNRNALEKLVEKPAKKSVFVLDAKTWPKTTRLAKQLAAQHGEVDCSDLKGAPLLKWLSDTATTVYNATLARDAGPLLVEAVGEDLASLDTELAKLASHAGAGGRIEATAVRELVGGWKAETTWALTDAVRENRLDDAFAALDDLLIAGEAPQKLMGGITFVFRKVAAATELSRSMPLDQALKQAGLFPKEIGLVSSYLRRIGRPQAERTLQRLINTDAGLKGASRLLERIQLEKLLIELSGQVQPGR